MNSKLLCYVLNKIYIDHVAFILNNEDEDPPIKTNNDNSRVGQNDIDGNWSTMPDWKNHWLFQGISSYVSSYTRFVTKFSTFQIEQVRKQFQQAIDR